MEMWLGGMLCLWLERASILTVAMPLLAQSASLSPMTRRVKPPFLRRPSALLSDIHLSTHPPTRGEYAPGQAPPRLAPAAHRDIASATPVPPRSAQLHV